ncbi:MAG: CDP-alcohol phosphatidyltransferase family protein [Bacteroidota bacterium]
MTKHIPNFVTLLNLFSGCVAAIFAVQGHLIWAAYFVFLGIVFDFLDGLLARFLDARSDLGLELDSLADVVTSGVVPGLIMYQLLALSLNVSNEVIDAGHWSHEDSMPFSWQNYLPFLGLIIPLASAYRLAKFNLDSEQQHYFKGLPTPANALLIMSLPLILEFQNNDLINSQILNPIVLIILTLASAFLLNAPIKLLALKFKSFDVASNMNRYLFLILSIVLLLVFKFAAIPLIILLYCLISLGMPKQFQ